MRKDYEAPKAQKLDFDYKNVVVASGGGGDDNGDNGQGKGCKGYTYEGDQNGNHCTLITP